MKEIYLTEVREQPIGIDVRIKVLYDVQSLGPKFQRLSHFAEQVARIDQAAVAVRPGTGDGCQLNLLAWAVHETCRRSWWWIANVVRRRSRW